jgi:hypothetical protein
MTNKKCYKYKVQVYFKNRFEYDYFVNACSNYHALNIAKIRMRYKYGTDKQHTFKTIRIK